MSNKEIKLEKSKQIQGYSGLNSTLNIHVIRVLGREEKQYGV